MMQNQIFRFALFLFCLFALPFCLEAQATSPESTNLPSLIPSQLSPIQQYDFLSVRSQIRIIGFLVIISLIPFGVMIMTSFTRISIVLQFLRQALGSMQVPSNQILIGLSLILTGFIMHPVFTQINNQALTPYLKGELKNAPQVHNNKMTEEELFLTKAWAPLRKFLLSHTREKDLELFLEIGNIKLPSPADASEEEETKAIDSIPWYCIVPSFIMSELRTAFMMGFLLFLPFLIIDMVVASVLMSMGMMMLPPVMVSTPFKLLLFILIDGWRLIIQQIVSGFNSVG